MRNSKIEWTDHTFNPWWGCVKVSPACDWCYAEQFANRKTRTKEPLWGKDAHRLISGGHYWEEPLRWNRRAETRQRVFCGSMCDVMERRDDLDAPRQRLFALIDATPNLDWLLLTKRPQEYAKQLPSCWLDQPRQNVWLMTTVEHSDYLWRIQELLKAPALVHGLSIEPLLGPVTLPQEFLALGSRAWVIAGGETGRKPRPTDPEWFRSLRDQCAAAGVPYFFKQWGDHGADLVRIGRKAAGRELDGREWNQLPLDRAA